MPFYGAFIFKTVFVRTMGKTIKSLLIAIAVRLQFPPFLWLFRWVYHLAIKVSILSIRRIPGVKAIYLSGSLARGDVIYGLSDIDFKIFVHGRRDKSILEAIQDRFALLRKIFPMLGPPDEKGVYFQDDFVTDYHRYPLIQHLFDRWFYQHQRLWGEAAMDPLPLLPLRGVEAHLSYLWRLKCWLEIVMTLNDSPALTEIQKRYLFYKAIGDLSLIYVRLQDPDGSNGGRERALSQMEPYANPEERGCLTQLLKERRLYFRKQIIPLEASYSLFRNFMERCCERLEACDEGPSSSLNTPSLWKGSFQIEGGSNEKDRIKGLCPPDVEILVVPWPHLPLNPLDCKYFGTPTYLIVSKRPFRLEEINRLKRVYRSGMIHQATVLIKDNPHYLYSPFSEQMDHWLSTGISDELTFRLFEAQTTQPMPSLQTERIKERLNIYLSQVEEMMGKEDLYRIDRKIYMQFLFTLVRSLALYRSLLAGRVDFPLKDAEEVASYLKENTPLTHSFIERLQDEYLAVTGSRRPFCEAFFKKTKVFAETFLEVAKTHPSLEGLAWLNRMEDLQTLSISVVIITRSRCVQLTRCLASLLRLDRPPDELIVVDNASRDATREMVQNYQAPFPVRYAYVPEVGYSTARNAGVRIARGEVITFIDDDATVEPEWLTLIENAFLRDPRIGMVGGSIHNMKSDRKDLVYRYFDLVGRM